MYTSWLIYELLKNHYCQLHFAYMYIYNNAKLEIMSHYIFPFIIHMHYIDSKKKEGKNENRNSMDVVGPHPCQPWHSKIDRYISPPDS